MLVSLRASVPITVLQSQADLKGDEEFDLLVIGGGATGSGVAVDAASRGLKVALVDRGDFSSGAAIRYFNDIDNSPLNYPLTVRYFI